MKSEFFRIMVKSILVTYTASKMAVEIIAKTLGLELEPFRVKVFSAVSGALKNMGQWQKTLFGLFFLLLFSFFCFFFGRDHP